MIITCNYCNKKFNLDSNLIPDKGRLLECSSCEHKWFFKKATISSEDDKEGVTFFKQNNATNNIETDPSVMAKGKIEASIDRELDIEIGKNIVVNKINDLSKKTKLKNQKNFKKFNIFIVTIISFVAFIIIIDTFKFPFGKVVPSIELMLYNLYESTKDVSLLVKDLI